MRLEVYTLKDKIKLKSWLESIPNQDDELKFTIDRLHREILYSEESEKQRETILERLSISEAFEKHSKEKGNRFQELKSIDHSKAIQYLKEVGRSFDDETLAYAPEWEFSGYRNNLSDLLDYCIEIVHRTPNISDYEFYNDEIDEWYFKGSTLNPKYFFPSECFLLKFGEDFLKYSETHGQGTLFSIKYCGDLKSYGASFGCSEKMTLSKVIEVE